VLDLSVGGVNRGFSNCKSKFFESSNLKSTQHRYPARFGALRHCFLVPALLVRGRLYPEWSFIVFLSVYVEE
jgi:hypothetical protein